MPHLLGRVCAHQYGHHLPAPLHDTPAATSSEALCPLCVLKPIPAAGWVDYAALQGPPACGQFGSGMGRNAHGSAQIA